MSKFQLHSAQLRPAMLHLYGSRLRQLEEQKVPINRIGVRKM